MKQVKKDSVEESPWQSLCRYTQARIALGRCGCSVPTRELMAFKLAHAKAIDAVHLPLDLALTARKIREITALPTVTLSSAAPDRQAYLQRPDLGRLLSPDSVSQLSRIDKGGTYDISLVVADGLSSTAISRNIDPLMRQLVPGLKQKGYRLAPVSVIEQARVAVADQVARLQHSRMTVIFIGERPGLKSPDSLGIYMTYNPEEGTTDERRNCISNVRKNGLSYAAASFKLMYLIEEAFRRKLSGVNLKDNQIGHQLLSGSKKISFPA